MIIFTKLKNYAIRVQTIYINNKIKTLKLRYFKLSKRRKKWYFYFVVHKCKYNNKYMDTKKSNKSEM